MKLRRAVATYEACSANEVASGSKAQMIYFVEDAQKDIGALADLVQDMATALREATAALQGADLGSVIDLDYLGELITKAEGRA